VLGESRLPWRECCSWRSGAGETLARAVKLAHGIWLRARGRQVQLAALRDTTSRSWRRIARRRAAAQLQEMNRLRHAQAAEMQVGHTPLPLRTVTGRRGWPNGSGRAAGESLAAAGAAPSGAGRYSAETIDSALTTSWSN